MNFDSPSPNWYEPPEPTRADYAEKFYDLLEVMKEIAAYGSDVDFDDLAPAWNEVQELARTAVNKAEGKR